MASKTQSSFFAGVGLGSFVGVEVEEGFDAAVCVCVCERGRMRVCDRECASE